VHGIAIVPLMLVARAIAVELPVDVDEISVRHFALPVQIHTDGDGPLSKLRFFVSQDGGKTWKHVKDYSPEAKQLSFSAPDDGLYCFSIQTISLDGVQKPRHVDNLVAIKQVFVNTQGWSIRRKKSYGELQLETDELRKKIDALEKQLKSLRPPASSSGKRPRRLGADYRVSAQ
jgi:hypothetical protein